jgi:hypothetical protein
MTNEQAKIVADYMGYLTHPMGSWYDAPVYFAAGKAGNINFDLNDAGLVVEEMVKRDEWDSFIDSIEERTSEIHATWVNLFAWLFNADNFFEAFVYWRKGK